MSPGPTHARQRRRRLLALVATLLVVTVVSPRLQDKVVPPDEDEAPMRVASRSVRWAAAGSEREATAGSTRGAGRDLFNYESAPVLAAMLEQRSPVPGSEVHYISLNRELLVGKDSVFWQPGGRFTVPLPNREVIEVEIHTTEAIGPDEFTSEGHIIGVPEGRAIFAYSFGKFSARFENLPQGDFQLRSLTDPKGNSVNQFYAVDPGQIPGCGGQVEAGQDEVPTLWVDHGKGRPRPPVAAGDAHEAPLEALVSGQAIVDVLMVYTRAAREAVGSADDLRAEILLGVAKVNSDFRNSAITARIRLAGTMEVEYPDDALPEQNGFQATTLDRLRRPADGFLDEVHAQREAVGADLVCLLLRRLDSDSAGIAYILKDPRDYVGSFFSFSVVQSTLVAGAGSVLSHELGHNFGAAHARQDPGAMGTQDGAYPYSYGHRLQGSDTSGNVLQARTIMAYDFGSQQIPRVPYFSNPRLTLPSVTVRGVTYRFNPEPALGIAEGAAAADNARTIEQNAFQVASYRVSTDYSAAGHLVNVSTRAVVGSGTQAMIGGFVVAGGGTQRVLVRAVGPTLTEFGLRNPLADPILSIQRSGTATPWTNDDWWRDAAGATSPAYVASLRGAFSASGAFPLPENSRDAALVLDLPPGAYSAIITGKSGTPGEALVEAYQLEGRESRLINLSTRAYGSTTQPIHAGFVVRADPLQKNQRKRMLVRVLGPSLAQFNLAPSTLMSDPVMQIFDAKGQLILENDDWDPPTTRLEGSEVALTTRGTVDQTPERLVFEAMKSVGVADGSMRPVEPAAVLELPPGSYTVRVAPFEDLSANSPQPAQPGIAIVEVFELSGSAPRAE